MIAIVTIILDVILTSVFGTDEYGQLAGPGGIIKGIYQLLLILPGLSVFVRRMHDTGHSGWNWFWIWLPIIGWIIQLIYLCRDSDKGTNAYAASEKYPEA